MNSYLNLPTMFATHRLLKGILAQRSNGQVVLKTDQGNIPVQLEGSEAPFGREIIFRVIREEPGMIVLSPYHIESLTEALPFLKELFRTDQQSALELIQAITNENLPLSREVFTDLKRWMLTAEKVWGVKVHPQAFTFLMAKELPITPKTVLLAIYTLFPSIQKEMWRMTEKGQQISQGWAEIWRGGQVPARGSTVRPEDVGPRIEARIFTFLTELPKVVKKNYANYSFPGKKEKEQMLPQAVTFLEAEARHDLSLPHFLFYLSSEDGRQQVKWEGRGERAGEAEPSGNYSFRLGYQSPTLGAIEVIGVRNPTGLQLTIRAESSLALDRLKAMQPYLETKGWSISKFQLESVREIGNKDRSIPLRVDGWL